ncbi:MAG: hypothetical protein COB81_00175 [Flavobacteriaceae bacterium]|nr:MAG: hypothetical protein COB81_00175 [Flavobacteriaceae bacterium]
MKNDFDKIVLGTASIGGVWGTVDFKESIATILFALEKGINQIDTAPAYMDAELMVGKALSQWHGNAPFVSTKIGKKKGMATETGLIDYSDDYLKRSLDNSLTVLNVSKIDLLFLHEPSEIDPLQINRILKTIHSFKEQGLIKEIGLGGAPLPWMTPIINEGVFTTIMDFNGYNLIDKKPLLQKVDLFEKNNMSIYEASPLMMGVLGDKLKENLKNPSDWLTKSTMDKVMRLKQLGEKMNISLSEMAHRFLLKDYLLSKIVIGPSNLIQLKQTMWSFQKGKLPVLVLEEINKVLR